MIKEPPPIETPGRLVFRALYGSHAHGTATPTSDEDWRGVFLLPNDAFLGLSRPTQTHEDKAHDQVFWELGHFCRLLLKGNPNLVGMLWAPEDCIDFIDASIRPLFTFRHLFIHQATIAAYMGWVKRELRDIGSLHKGNAKRLSHVPRLLWEIESAITTGDIDVRPTGDHHDTIMAIKTGQMPYDNAVALCGSLLLDLELLVEQSPVPPEPPTEWTLKYLLETRELCGR